MGLHLRQESCIGSKTNHHKEPREVYDVAIVSGYCPGIRGISPKYKLSPVYYTTLHNPVIDQCLLLATPASMSCQNSLENMRNLATEGEHQSVTNPSFAMPKIPNITNLCRTMIDDVAASPSCGTVDVPGFIDKHQSTLSRQGTCSRKMYHLATLSKMSVAKQYILRK